MRPNHRHNDRSLAAPGPTPRSRVAALAALTTLALCLQPACSSGPDEPTARDPDGGPGADLSTPSDASGRTDQGENPPDSSGEPPDLDGASDDGGGLDGGTQPPGDGGEPTADAAATPDAADAGAEPAWGLPPAAQEHPSLFVTPDRRALLRQRLDQAPLDEVLVRLQQVAARPYREEDPPAIWDYEAHSANGETAQANATLAWLLEDEAAATKAASFLERLPTDFGNAGALDVHIRMPHVLMGYTNALDLLLGTPWLGASAAGRARGRILELAAGLYEAYVQGPLRGAMLQIPQNNYNVRTAAALAYVALAFPEADGAGEWASWAFGELAYLLGPDGHYLLPDGGVSEEPYYFNLSFAPALAVALAWRHRSGAGRWFASDCRTRSEHEAWADHGCEPGAPFLFDGLPGLSAAAEWSLALRLPWGPRPPIGDGRYIGLTGGAVLGALNGDGALVWDWQTERFRPLDMRYSLDLIPHHLAWLDPALPSAPPAWSTRFFDDSGHAVFRSGWDPDARWLLLLAEPGDARRALHDHVDSTSFTLAAYGEYLLIDPGYYKPNMLANALTAQSPSHNVVLIEGRSAPDKGLLQDYGDADAALELTEAGERIQYAQARQSYQGTEVRRGVVFVRRRYFVVLDRLLAPGQPPRAHAWRCHGNAGHEAGGRFELLDDGALWERTTAGVRLYLASSAPGLRITEPPFAQWQAPHVDEMATHASPGHHKVIDGLVEAQAPWFVAILAPYAVEAGDNEDSAPLTVVPAALAGAGPGWLVTTQQGTDLVTLRPDGAPNELELPDGRVVATDGDALVLDLAAPPTHALLVGGTYLDLDGERLLEGPAEVGVLAFE